MSSQVIDKQTIWGALRSSILEVLPELVNHELKTEDSLRELGANSIDRAEIINLTLRQLKLQRPLISFALARNLGEIMDIVYDAEQ